MVMSLAEFFENYKAEPPAQVATYTLDKKTGEVKPSIGCCVGDWYNRFNRVLQRNTDEAQVENHEVVFAWSVQSREVDALWCDFLVEEGILTEEDIDITELYEHYSGACRGLVLEDGKYTGRAMAMVYQLTRASKEYLEGLPLENIEKRIACFREHREAITNNDPFLNRMVLLASLSGAHSIYLLRRYQRNPSANLIMLFVDDLVRGFDDVLNNCVKTAAIMNGVPKDAPLGKLPCGWQTVPDGLFTYVNENVGPLRQVYEDVAHVVCWHGRRLIHMDSLMSSFVDWLNKSNKDAGKKIKKATDEWTKLQCQEKKDGRTT